MNKNKAHILNTINCESTKTENEKKIDDIKNIILSDISALTELVNKNFYETNLTIDNLCEDVKKTIKDESITDEDNDKLAQKVNEILIVFLSSQNEIIDLQSHKLSHKISNFLMNNETTGKEKMKISLINHILIKLISNLKEETQKKTYELLFGLSDFFKSMFTKYDLIIDVV